MASARPSRAPQHSRTSGARSLGGRTAPARRPQPADPRRKQQQAAPRLKVIPGGGEAAAAVSQGGTSRRAPRPTIPAASLKFAAAATAVVASCVFGVVLLQVMLAQTSFELHKIHSELVSEETKYRHMRFEVANAEAPEKIHQAAARLGLVVPAEQRYVFGPDAPASSSNEGSTRPVQQPNDKAGLKAVLSKQP